MKRETRRPVPPGSTVPLEMIRVATGSEEIEDQVAAEEPLEIRVVSRVGGEAISESVAVTMRTPGHDFELAAGFLLSEGVVAGNDDIWRLARCSEAPDAGVDNIVEAHLAPHVDFDASRFSRHVYTTSSCGICGKASIERLNDVDVQRPDAGFEIEADVLRAVPSRLAAAQTIFARTGGLHAAALFDRRGELLVLREDVGRHNALDKVIGSRLLAATLPIDDAFVAVSGRAGFELVQKSLVAGVPLLAAVGAPSSLAVAAAREFGLGLVGFLRSDRFNVYSAPERILSSRRREAPGTRENR